MISRRLSMLLLAGGLLAAGLPGPASAQLFTGEPNTADVFFTSDVQGAIKSCGCVELDLGGITHRAAFVDTARALGHPFLLVDAGGLSPAGAPNAQTLLKMETLLRSMAGMKFDAVALGDRDLAHGADYAAQLETWLGQPFLATNLTLPPSVPSIPVKEVTVGDYRIGVVSFLDPGLVTEDLAWVQVAPWEAMKGTMDDLAGRVDAIVALATVADSTRLADLARLYPRITLAIGGHHGGLVPFPTTIGRTVIIGGGNDGKLQGRARIRFDDKRDPYAVEAMMLNVVNTWGRAKWVDDYIADYNRRLRALLIEGASGG